MLNAYFQGRKRLSAGETLEGFLLAYVHGGLPMEERHPQPLRIELHVLAPDGKGGRRRRQVLFIEHNFPVVCCKHQGARVSERHETGVPGERLLDHLPVPSSQPATPLQAGVPQSKRATAQQGLWMSPNFSGATQPDEADAIR